MIQLLIFLLLTSMILLASQVVKQAITKVNQLNYSHYSNNANFMGLILRKSILYTDCIDLHFLANEGSSRSSDANANVSSECVMSLCMFRNTKPLTRGQVFDSVIHYFCLLRY